jgi:NAD-dependent SIR2 family protein deacetylase
MVVEAHGSFSRHKCIDCGTPFPNERMEAAVMAKEIPRCVRAECGGLVKPEIVFFGEQLPETFHLNRTLPGAADLCIIMGTSLSVQPFASLPGFCAEGVPRCVTLPTLHPFSSLFHFLGAPPFTLLALFRHAAACQSPPTLWLTP